MVRYLRENAVAVERPVGRYYPGGALTLPTRGLAVDSHDDLYVVPVLAAR